MSVYINDNVEHFNLALKSVLESSLLPDEVCIVCDGPISNEQEDIILSYSNSLSIKTVRLEKNIGLGLALREGLLYCSHDIIARFDSDDICERTRFQKQFSYMVQHKDIGVVGSWIGEFDEDPTKPHSFRKPPLDHADIVKYAKSRNPFNHMTVMYRKSLVLLAGNYQDNYLYEDYALWVRMIQTGVLMKNLPDILVYARAGNGMEIRRGGIKYAISEIKAQVLFYKSDFLSRTLLVKNILTRVPIRIVPGAFRKFIYRAFLRQ